MRNKGRNDERGDEHLVKVLTAPFCSILTSMTVKHSEETLAVYLRKGGKKGMGILHESPRTLGMGDRTSKSNVFRQIGVRALMRQLRMIQNKVQMN